jgi:DNA-binding response OmpR family regulator
VEEYDALAAAIRSALKKFAPQSVVTVARTLEEAAAAIESATPELVIIDFDPAFPGLTNFLWGARRNCPDARAILIGSGIDGDTAREFRRFGAMQFLPKPYEIADFGATVQALLATSDDVALQSLGVADLTLAQCAGGRSTMLEVQSNGKRGEIYIHDGEIVHAKTANRKNAQALEQIFAWADAKITEGEAPRSPTRSIRDNWIDIFFSALKEPKPRRIPSRPEPVAPPPPVAVAAPPPAVIEPAPPPAIVEVAPQPPPPPKTGKKIIVVDDTEMLLLFVEDALSFADPQLRITTAPTGMTGLKEIETLQPDLVLLDYSLPDINGDEVCRRLMANENTARIPVVMMSGHVAEMTRSADTFSNIVATIAKPFMSEALVALVQQTLTLGLRPKPKPAPPKPAPPPAPKVVRQKPAPVAVEPKVIKEKAAPPPPPVPPVVRQEPRIVAVEPKIIEEKVAPPPPPPAPKPVRSTITSPPPEPTLAEIPRIFPREHAIATPVISKTGSEVVLGLYLEVVAMRLTPSLRMGTIRARPSSLTVSLHVSPATIPAEIAFELGRTELDPNNRVSKLRLVPTRRPFERRATHAAVRVGALNLVPQDSRGQVQLTPSPDAPMTMHLLAHLDLAGVELSTNFELGQIVLQSRSQTVRVTLGSEQTGVFCEIAGVRLDGSGRISEILLNPLK